MKISFTLTLYASTPNLNISSSLSDIAIIGNYESFLPVTESGIKRSIIKSRRCFKLTIENKQPKEISSVRF